MECDEHECKYERHSQFRCVVISRRHIERNTDHFGGEWKKQTETANYLHSVQVLKKEMKSHSSSERNFFKSTFFFSNLEVLICLFFNICMKSVCIWIRQIMFQIIQWITIFISFEFIQILKKFIVSLWRFLVFVSSFYVITQKIVTFLFCSEKILPATELC